MHEHTGVSIWFFIGILLLAYGLLIIGADVWSQSHPPEKAVVLAQYRAGLWWGMLLTAIGLFYSLKFRPKSH